MTFGDGGVLRVGNCSGFYGDRLSAMREMLEGGDLDVLTGDYLAELTMLILGRDQMKDPSLGYARTFVTQVDRLPRRSRSSEGVRLVANAGGLNPAGLADRLREVAAEQGIDAQVAYVDGDALVDRAEELGLTGDGKPLTANAYLGAFGIAAALAGGRRRRRHRAGHRRLGGRRSGGRRTSAGRATTYDALAGAVVAGHVIECGAQATGGNFSGFRALLDAGLGDRPLGFPLAEIHADGTSRDHQAPGHGRARRRSTP